MTKKAVTKTKKSIKQEEIIGVDLGCGQIKQPIEFFTENFKKTPDKIIGVDIVKCPGVDIVHDLTKFPYPFKDESVDMIFASHFVEHLDGFERMKFFDECHRILKSEGKIRLVHPYYKSVRAIQDPTHKWPPISENSYLYWSQEWRKMNKLDHYPIKCDFEFNIFYTWQDPTAANKNEETKMFMVDKYWNVVADMIVDLTKK